jgi:hypothetical protein
MYQAASAEAWGTSYNMPHGYAPGMWRTESGGAFQPVWDRRHFNYKNSKFPRNPAPAPAASPWKRTVGNSGMEDIDDKDVTVVIGNLPKLLCSDKYFEVALDSAQVLPFVRLFAVKEIEDSGEATVILKGERAAVTVIEHFRGLSCGKPSRGSRGITTRYSSEAGRKLMLSKAEKQDTEEKKSEKETATALVKRKAKVEPANNVVPLVLTRTNLKKRWADVEDDSESDLEEEEDTRSTVASTVAGVVPSSVDPDGMESSNPDEF